MDFYHVLNRGVEKRAIVMNDSDRYRFLQGLYLYNNKNILDNNVRRKDSSRVLKTKREPLVRIHAFCLMDNHYHLLLSPVDDDPTNLSAFMRKLNMGYSKYFNEKYERSGALWQGKYKKILIQRDAHFLYIPYYIHLNPLDIQFSDWREGLLTKQSEAVKFLEKYKWSSFLNYIGISNYNSILDTKILSDILGSRSQQLETIKQITQSRELSVNSNKLEK